VADSLEYVANWNAAMLLSADIQQAVMASMSKTPARFAD
jgi:enoyl-CoA hydratase